MKNINVQLRQFSETYEGFAMYAFVLALFQLFLILHTSLVAYMAVVYSCIVSNIPLEVKTTQTQTTEQ